MYAVIDAQGAELASFDSWAAAARFQTAWERQNMRPATITPIVVMMEASPIENSRPVVALIRLIGWMTSAPSRREARA